MLLSRENKNASRKTYSRLTSTVIDEPSKKRKCSEQNSTTHLLSQTQSSTLKTTLGEDCELRKRSDIRNFFRLASLPPESPKKGTTPSSSSSRCQIRRDKRRLRLAKLDSSKNSGDYSKFRASSVRLSQQTIAHKTKELVCCNVCGMIYTFWEEKCHIRYHQKISLEFQTLIKCKKATIFEQKFEGKILCIQVIDRNMDRNLRNIGERAIQFSSDNGLEMEAFKPEILWGLINNPHFPDDPDQVHHYKLYTMFHGTQLVALLLAERTGYAEHQCNDVKTNCKCKKTKENNDISEVAKSKSSFEARRKVFMSVDRIWVHQKYQRKGLATIIVDEARANFLKPLVLSKDQVAVSWPTNDGAQFFSKYFREIFKSSFENEQIPYLVNSADISSLTSSIKPFISRVSS
ncbi:putative sister chromatid cohesion acetyltransferase eco1 [Golovinomyces cichoracearum]|uniref:Putative sister chromatid cohesion acetyltransferase eco1 n=1 Tax=Golovinomyces cichoracearum TaxID=62708 RepID=A0A420I6M6_9PEZI|nr:putative sister chromatid cohesion acetyltransferase eco1 [Golovinomyces cichoracearum]